MKERLFASSYSVVTVLVPALSSALIVLSGYSASASCFDRTIAVARYTYLDPTNLNEIYQDIYKIDLSNSGPGNVVRLSIGALSVTPYDNTNFAWSPDGGELVFVSSRMGLPELFAMDTEDIDGDGQGDNLVSLGNADTELSAPHWIAGDQFAFIKGDTDGNGQVHTAGIGSSPLALSNVAAATVGGNYKLGSRYTADGQLIGYVEEYVLSGLGRFYGLAVLRPADGLQILLSDSALVENGFDWVPGEVRVIFSSDHGDPGASLDLYSAEVDLAAPPHLKNVQRITSTPAVTETNPRISPDGQCLGYTANDGTVPYGPNDDLHIVDLQTGEDRRITSSRDIAGFAWRP